jgi:hypothetical protein
VKVHPVAGVFLSHPVPAGYNYGNLALDVEGISNETVRYIVKDHWGL